MSDKHSTLIDRFVLKTKKVPSGCIEWQGATHDGYGWFYDGVKGPKKAHRISWDIFIGAIPDGLHVCHSCDNRLCVKPNHLFLGTNQDNVADMISKGRQRKGVDHRSAKLTPEKIRDIRFRIENGESERIVGESHGINQSTAHRIFKRLIWKHVL